jgi:hypothetical protein
MPFSKWTRKEKMRFLPSFATLLCGLLFAATAALAETATEEPSPIRLFGRVGLSAGGEKLSSGTYVNTGDTFRISAGGGTSAAVGLEFRLNDTWAVQVTTGAQKDKTNATNGEIKFARSAKEVLGFYSLSPQWRIGGGVRQDSDVKLTMRHDSGAQGYSDFDNASAVVLEAQYFFFLPNQKAAHSLQSGVSFRAVQQTFKEKLTGKSYDGNQVGVALFLYY